MKKILTENVLNQRKLLTHVWIILLSLVVVFMNVLISSDLKTWDRYLSGFILIFSQVEVFIFLAHLIFRNIKPGKTALEITKRAFVRFMTFLIACFIAAFIIIIVFSYTRQIISKGDLTKVLPDFFTHTFNPWLKSTLGGLIFGTGIFIIALWQDALRREQKLREENLIFQHETLKNQVNPHFLFNSLNTLSSLIVIHPEIAEEFINRLSSIYRYILENSSKDRVPLKAELSFITDYFYLHRIRDDGKIELEIKADGPDLFDIIPVSLQILVENAIKHNKATREDPLRITIYIEGQHIIVKNNLQKMASGIRSTGIGLKNLTQRVKLISKRDLIIEESNAFFMVKVPLLT
jgi:hypothetical protein